MNFWKPGYIQSFVQKHVSVVPDSESLISFFLQRKSWNGTFWSLTLRHWAKVNSMPPGPSYGDVTLQFEFTLSSLAGSKDPQHPIVAIRKSIRRRACARTKW